MTNSLKKLILFLTFLHFIHASSAGAHELPQNLQAALLSKLAHHELNLASKKNWRIAIVGEPKIYQSLNLMIARKRLENVGKLEYFEQLPEQGFDLVYINNIETAEKLTQYALTHAAIVVSGRYHNVEQGVVVAMSVESGKPKLHLNKALSDKIGLVWDEQLLRFAKLY